MKKLFFVLTTAVLLLFLAACEGSFVDPGMMDSIGAGSLDDIGGIGSGGSSGGGLFDKPAVPKNVKATAESSSSIKITWSEVSGTYISYNVYRSKSSSGKYEFIDDTYSTSYTDRGLDSNTTYYYKVSAESLFGEESAQSSYASAKTK
jgi:hypothetical protein